MHQRIDRIRKLRLENTQIVSAAYESGGEFCRVVWETSFGKGSLINSEIWLPADWNGIFAGLGNGGMAGAIWHDSLEVYMKMGYAVAQTDMGTSGGRKCGVGNPEVWKDFGWRATHAMTETGKEIVCAFYGSRAEYSYFIGGSTGGQQALSEAQRFPQDYDGIIAGVPANNRVFLHTYFLWNHNHLRTPDGRVMFSEQEIRRISECAAEYFQSIGDGEAGDRFVSFPYAGADTVKNFISYLGKSCPFSAEQLSTLEAVYNGPVNPVTGKQIYNGMPIGSEMYGCGISDCQSEESPHFYPFVWAFGEDYNGYDFDFNKDLERLGDVLSGDLDANSADLDAFKKHGGKLIAYSGSADPCVPFPDAMGYTGRVMEKMGGYNKAAECFRYFLLPGKDHGEGGLGANVLWGDTAGKTDALDSLRLWREKGIAPQYLVAARVENGQTVFARKIYPYGSGQNPKREFTKICEYIK